LANCGEWHVIARFSRSVPPPIYCGFLYDPESEIKPPGRGKKPPLTNLSILLKFSQFYPPESEILGIYPSGGFYEKGSPEVANSKKFY
jgi:hypothetical protein